VSGNSNQRFEFSIHFILGYSVFDIGY